MDSSKIIVGLIIVFFIILFCLLIAYIVQVGRVNAQYKKMDILPPPEYMSKIGARCPDYWKYMGLDENGNNICKNELNVPVWNPDNNNCYDNKDKRTKTFVPANISMKKENGEEIFTMDNEAEKQRCKFVSQCGPSETLEASWLGVNSSGITGGYTSCGNL